MFTLAIFIGIYSYLIFVLGLLGILSKRYVIESSLLFVLLAFFYKKKLFFEFFIKSPLRFSLKSIKNNKLQSICVFFIICQLVVNLIGALGPELGFDALWYHLTLPKIYIIYRSIQHIPGGLLYYSDMPKLSEMLYTAALSIDSEILAKVIHFLFGVLATIATYMLANIFYNKKISIIASLIFYSNLVVAWESITAYIDLARTFFEVMALWGFILWIKKGQKKWFVVSGITLGLAICTKTLAIGDIVIFILLIIFTGNLHKKTNEEIFQNILLYIITALLIPLPWFVNAFINTHNPLYPLFTNYEIHQTFGEVINPLRFIRLGWQILTKSADPLSPVYIAFLPLAIFEICRFKKELSEGKKIIILYSFFSFILWYITPQTGGGRFILPYLPAYSLLVASVFTYNYTKWFRRSLLGFVFLIAGISIVYRGFANVRYIPFILGRETKAEFLTNHLNFSFGDFYDTDGFFVKHIKPTDKVLLYGFHNLYYVNFPFIDNSWVKKGERFNYIAVQNGELPKRFSHWYSIYVNRKTRVKVYMMNNAAWTSY